jgi:GTP-binding protein
MFDRAEIRVKAGKGGSGAISFRHEKFVPFGGPDGGDGGKGGSVIIRADDAVDSLRRYRQSRLYRASNGGNGMGSRKHGRDGDDLVLMVPAGTIVNVIGRNESEGPAADLEKPGDEVIAARGGKGGWGNTHFASSTNQAPHIAQRGEHGEELTVRLEMRLIADVGIIGYPNTGKSTLLGSASAAKPKVASYPFTTIEPILGVVEVGLDSFVMAEIPGLIEDAHLGRGLGHDFLRHALRTKILIHLVSGTAESPVDDMMHINEELALYEPALARKPQIVALNKIDLPEVQARLASIRDELTSAGVKAYYISAATGQGVSGLMAEALKLLKTVVVGEMPVKSPVKVFRPQPRDTGIRVSKVGDEYYLTVPGLERLITGTGIGPAELRWQLNQQLQRMGYAKAMEKSGVKPGDKIHLGDFTWEW